LRAEGSAAREREVCEPPLTRAAPRRPVNRSSLTAHLQRTLRQPVNEGLTVGKALRWFGGAVAFYFAANLALGGRKRIDHDLGRIKVRRPFCLASAAAPR